MFATIRCHELITAGSIAALVAAISPAAAGTLSVFHSFTGGSDGANPSGNTVVDPQGNIFGIAANGGMDCTTRAACSGVGCGVLWEVNSAGQFSVIVSFFGWNGAVPNHLALNPDGAIVGTTAGGGDSDDGLLYIVNKDGTNFQMLRQFSGVAGCGSNAPWVDSRTGDIWDVDNCAGTNKAEIYTLTRSLNRRDYTFGVYFNVPARYHVSSHVVGN
jgi:hypothetical protein